MRSYIVTIDETQFVEDPEAVFMAIKGVNHIEAQLDNTIQYDPNIYDADGNFQWISLAGPGLPVPDEYMAWRIDQSLQSLEEGKGITLEQLKENMAKRRKEAFNR